MEGIDMKWMSVLLTFHKTIFLGVFSLLSTLAVAADAQPQVVPYTEGAVHEAYVTPSTEGGAVLRSIPHQPPEPLNEQQPQQCLSDSVWIPGYWSWNEELKDFIWISGLWRSVPPYQVWIPGLWKQIGSDWVWLSGFWSPVPLENIQYIADHPLAPKEEAIPAAPGEDYYWMPGYWNYNFASQQYGWLAGKWVKFDPEWVYVPAYYLWRPEGYIFVPAYWDQPLELRGCPFSPVRIASADRASLVYTPTLVLQPESIIHWCFTHYPDYALFFWHHRYYHPDFWERWCCTPPWWNWETDTCWCFNWYETWGLWWWWTHPGYPNPHWINLDLSSQIVPPTAELISWMHEVQPPPIITPWGAVAPGVLIDAIGGKEPVLPSNEEKVVKIYDKLKPEHAMTESLLPTGKKSAISLPRPEVGEGHFPKEQHVTPPPKPIRVPESPVEPPTYVVPKPQVAYPALPSPPQGYLPAVPKPFYEQEKQEERSAGYYKPRSRRQNQRYNQSSNSSSNRNSSNYWSN